MNTELNSFAAGEEQEEESSTRQKKEDMPQDAQRASFDMEDVLAEEELLQDSELVSLLNAEIMANLGDLPVFDLEEKLSEEMQGWLNELGFVNATSAGRLRILYVQQWNSCKRCCCQSDCACV